MVPKACSGRVFRHKSNRLRSSETTAKGFRLATSVGGVLVGRGANYIVLDDPLKPTEALSESARKSANEWFDHTLYSRLNDKRKGRILVVMQRLHEDDLVGHVQERERWDVLSFLAIAEKDEQFAIQTPFGMRKFSRKAGEALHPEREPLEVLQQIRRTLGEYNFAGQYQQAPAPASGGLVKRNWFRTYGEHELPRGFRHVVQSWDSANKVTELSDYSVCTTWGVRNKKLYLLDVLRKRLSYPELKKAVQQQAEKHSPTVILIEDKASGTQLVQDLTNDGLRIVKGIKPEGDKVMRFNAQTATIENGFVYIPKEASWLAEYVHEMTTFPGAKFDDQADSTAQALAWINQGSFRHGVFEYYRHENARELQRQGFSVERIAEELDEDPEEVLEWLKPPLVTPSSVDKKDLCVFCRKILLGPVVRTMDLLYHEECFRKFTAGEKPPK